MRKAATRMGPPDGVGSPRHFSSAKKNVFFGWRRSRTTRDTCSKVEGRAHRPCQETHLGSGSWLGVHANGVQELMSFLRQRLGRLQLPELSDLLLKYFRGTKRRAQESVNDYVTRKCEAYVRAQQSLKRVLQVAVVAWKSRPREATTLSSHGQHQGDEAAGIHATVRPEQMVVRRRIRLQPRPRQTLKGPMRLGDGTSGIGPRPAGDGVDRRPPGGTNLGARVLWRSRAGHP